jgi:hypothetical protein
MTVFNVTDSGPIVTFFPNGDIVINPAYTASEAAKEFWTFLAGYAKSSIPKNPVISDDEYDSFARLLNFLNDYDFKLVSTLSRSAGIELLESLAGATASLRLITQRLPEDSQFLG